MNSSISLEERRSRAALIVAVGLVALALLTAWTVILRRAPIEDDLSSRSAAALEQLGYPTTDLRFDGRDGAVTVEAPLAASAQQVIGSLEGVRTVDVTPVSPPATTTTTIPPTTTTAAPTTTTTTTEPPPEASFTLTSDGAGVTLSGNLTPGDAGAIVGAAERAFGADRVTDSITTDPATNSPVWVADLSAAIPILEFVAEPGLAIDGSSVTLAGEVSSEARRSAVLAAFGPLGIEIADGLAIAQAPSGEEATALETSLNAALEDASVLFGSGSSEVSADGSTQLDAIADLLIAVPGARVEVGGHTDSEGPTDGNLLLSTERAEAVVAYLIDGGVDPAQLTAAGYGESTPIAENNTPEGRAANRRIEFIVEGSA